MSIEFKEFREYKRGILYNQLLDSYSFDFKWKENFEKEWIKYDDFFYDHLQFTNSCGFIILLNEEPIGHISWDPRNLPEYVIIGHNCILTKYKGKGYGHILLQEAINRIKKYENIKKIIVTTNETLVPARHNYESVGFKCKNRRQNLDTPFSGDYIDYEIKL